MLVQSKTSNDPYVIGPKSDIAKAWAKLRPRLDRLPLELYSRRERVPYSIQWVPGGICKRIAQLEPDIVHLHWICGGYLSIEDIGYLRGRKLVWGLQDMWAFTGGCHYDRSCGRYEGACGECPYLHSERQKDLSHWVWRRKHRAWKDLDLTIVTISHWLATAVRRSSLFGDLRIEVIPNILDTDCFKPIDKELARHALGLSLRKKAVMFGAINATNNDRKGFHLLQTALQCLSNLLRRDEVQVVVFGASEPENSLDLGFNAYYLGFLRDNISLALVYSAADVMVVPSKQEAFGQTASEAMACGTPVVAFDATGLKDIVDHQQNGYLAEPFDTEDLAHGIQWVLENENRLRKLSQNARQKALREFNQELQARKYLALYEEILSQS